MKYVFRIILCIQIIILFSLAVYGNTGNMQIKEKVKQNTLSSAIEKEEVIKSFSNSIEQFERLINQDSKSSSVDIKIDKGTTLKNIEKSFKVFEVINGDIINGFRENNIFSGMISDNYYWIIPIFGSSEKIIYISTFQLGMKYEDIIKGNTGIAVADREAVIVAIKERAGKWNWSMLNNMIPGKWVEFLLNEDKLTETLSVNGIIDPEVIKLIPLPGFYTFMLYIMDDGKEYGIPFSQREDFTNLVSGNFYNMNELIDTIEHSPIYTERGKTFDEFGNLLYGGVSMQKVEGNNMNLRRDSVDLIHIILFVPALVLLFILVHLYNSRKRKMLVR